MHVVPVKILKYSLFVVRRWYRNIVGSMAITVAVLLMVLPAYTSRQGSPVIHGDQVREITLLFMGDIMQHMPQVEAAWDNERQIYNYDTCFTYIRPLIQSADIAIANLETTLAGKPYSGYPAFSSPDELAKGISDAGIDITGTANNHCCDRGRHGIERTIYVLDSLGLKHMGTYADKAAYEQHNPLIINRNGFRLAFLNYTYGTNGIPVPESKVVSLIENDRMVQDLKAARDSQPDKIVVFIHWGEEYQREPNAFQQETADFLFNNGADYIIGSHPHVIQPMAWYKADSTEKEKIVVWSLGNFVSNQRNRFTDGGSMFRLRLRKEYGQTSVAEASYYLTWVYNPINNGRRQYYILPAAKFEKDTAFIDRNSFPAMKTFIEDSREWLGSKNNSVNEAFPF